MTKFICAGCVDESAIKDFIDSGASESICSYCGEQAEDGPIAMSFEEVAEFIRRAIECEYEDPANSVGYESREGGYQLPLLNADDLINEVGLEFSNGDFIHDLSAELSDQPWIQKDPYGLSKDKELQYSWDRFSEQVTHETRFVFFKVSTSGPWLLEPEPYRVLEDIGKIVAELDLIRTISPGTEIVRARQHDSTITPCSSLDLGPPPKEYATQNRMSPAGIPMFHGAADEKTAFEETFRPDNAKTKVTFARFRTLRSLRLLELTDIPQVPSFFDEERAYLRSPLIFIRNFARSATQPIDRDAIHYRYVPTQVVAEYFRHVFLLTDGERLDGIVFNSSKNAGAQCYSLFMKNDDCSDSDKSKRLQLSGYRTIDID